METYDIKVQWILRELNLPYETEEVEVTPGQPGYDKLLSMNPFAKTPVLEVLSQQKDGTPFLYESGAILSYLADKHSDLKRLIPAPGTNERAVHDRWVLLTLLDLEGALWMAAKCKYVYPETISKPPVLDVALYEWTSHMKIVEKLIPEKGFLMGSEFSVADITLAYTFEWAHSANQLSDYPSSLRYLVRCLERSTSPFPQMAPLT